jgi:MoaA/NifB/PqqE/SkfB family radical SAM enzyme
MENMSRPSLYKQIKGLMKKYLPKKIIMLLYYIRRYWKRSQWLKKTVQEGSKRRNLLRFDIHLADHCNLKCKGCEHFSPLVEEKFLDIDTFDQDCSRLAELTKGKLEDIALLGGEPLLHPQLIEFLDIARKYFNTARLWIVTNGILLKKQSEIFWQSCKRNNVEINITIYPLHIDYDEIRRLAEKYDILLTFGGDLGVKPDWVQRPIDIYGKQSIEDSWKRCYQANHCIQLVAGKLYPCARIAYIQYFNRYFNQNLQVTESDYIDIYQINSIEEILNFLCKPVPFCRYCNLKQVIWDREWGVSKKQITEWI